MRKFLMTTLLALATSILLAAAGTAATIGFNPSSVTPNPGDVFSVDVVVSDPAGEIVSACDLDIVYDDAVASALSVNLTPALGDSGVDAFYDSEISTPGVADLAGGSLLSDADLLALQGGDSVVLATLTFEYIDGSTLLDFSFDAFNDVKGANGRSFRSA
jgi:hypothetical protein